MTGVMGWRASQSITPQNDDLNKQGLFSQDVDVGDVDVRDVGEVRDVKNVGCEGRGRGTWGTWTRDVRDAKDVDSQNSSKHDRQHLALVAHKVAV